MADARHLKTAEEALAIVTAKPSPYSVKQAAEIIARDESASLEARRAELARLSSMLQACIDACANRPPEAARRIMTVAIRSAIMLLDEKDPSA